MRTFGLLASLACLFGCASGARVEAGGPEMTTIRVAQGLTRPVWVTAPPRDFDRVFLLEQLGRIRILKNGALVDTPFLDIDPLVFGGTSLFDERGLLGLAFHPDYATNGFFFVWYVNSSQDTVLARYQVSENPDIANPSSALILLTIDQPTGFPNHKCGWIAFGPQGYLYVGTGDGGSANDPGNRAQDITSQLLGKILRLDVNGDDFPEDASKNYAIPPSNPFVGVTGDDEIWAYGLRNPWRNSFDAMTNELFIADVGQDEQEEINIQPATSPGGENYGWRCMEGVMCTGLSGCTCNAPNLTLPVYTYNHTTNPLRCSVTGGEVYRGCAFPQLQGVYFFAEYCSNEVWTLTRNGQDVVVTDVTAQLAPGGGLNLQGISSFGHDAYGEMYICDRDDGEVFKIVPVTPSPDCNQNGIVDACDLLDGSSLDADKSGVPDECEIPLSIVSSVPPDGAIDARQPSNIDGSNPTGWMFVDLTFSGVAVEMTADDLTLTQQGSNQAPPTILGLAPLTDFSVRAVLSGAVNVGAWTTITHNESGSHMRIGYLPGDVNADRTSSPVDILALIDAINGVGTPLPLWSTDIDRSGAVNPADILREIDLLNGADAFAVFNGMSLP